MFCLPELILRPTQCNGFFICWLKILRNANATPETLARVPYLKAWLQGTLCLYPVLSAIPRKPKEDIILGGYHIHGGTPQVEFLLKMPKRLNRRDGCETKMSLWSNQQRLSLLFHLDSNTYVPRSTYCRARVNKSVSTTSVIPYI